MSPYLVRYSAASGSYAPSVSVVSANSGCVVPPQRRVDLKRVRLPAVGVFDSREVNRRPTDDPLARQAPPDLQRLRRDALRVFGVGGEVAPEVRVAVKSSEHLVMTGHDVDLSGRAHAQLDAGTPEHLALDALLDDAALVVERLEVLIDAQLLVLELDRGVEVVSGTLEVEQRVAEAAHASVELENGTARSRAPRAKFLQRSRQIVGAPTPAP